MKSKLSKIGELTIPIILCLALIFTALLSITSIDNLQGNARVINYIGIVRGATQRLIKKELNHEPDDALIERLDNILYGLANGSDEFDLIKLEDQTFQAQLTEMESSWSIIKDEIYKVRTGSSNEALYAISEDYFVLADNTVRSAEEYTEQSVQIARNHLIILNTVFIILAGGCTVFTYYQEKRREMLIRIENENKRKSEQLTRQQRELLAPMNEISELMYVSDIDTYDLLFVNDAGKRIFNIGDDLSNLKCYKVIQGFDSPCEFCTNSRLKTDETYSWEYTNPLLQKHYLLKDRLIEWEGKTARMEIAFDITATNNEKNELKQRLERDNVLVDCIRELYHNHEITDALTTVLAHIGQLFSAERAYIFIFHDPYFSNIAEWCNTGIEPQIEHLQNVVMDDYRPWLELLEKDKNIIYDDIEILKDEMPAGYELLSQQDIKNIVWVPLEKDNGLSGCIGLDNLAYGMSDIVIPFLQTIQYFITLAMERNENEKTLYEMSYLDELTTFYNRNRYIQNITELEDLQGSVGVVYLDMNGLKGINDSLGHAAGDLALKACAEIIKNSSDSEKLYRIGGDEFVIIYTETNEEAFYDNVERLKNNFKQSAYQIAIGYKWEAECSNIQNVIKEADELMYADKMRFYQKHQTRRYRHEETVE
ncbi:sensor domain-containing diguanylate cyclase [Dielma fastidiosa]|uniref:GGDEF domain-containing protein n=1 Tax=Dielma fastidiosa TaxID=1034346 RepID=A0AB35UL64_9FIRM|nr:GGDEF domain-containing protein [Dielma fastidiosa]MDY5167462.1 GGDEF domain-containing protein [Dielma fastidiosa]